VSRRQTEATEWSLVTGRGDGCLVRSYFSPVLSIPRRLSLSLIIIRALCTKRIARRLEAMECTLEKELEQLEKVM